MPVLVVSDPDPASVTTATLCTGAAARQIDPDVHVLVAGKGLEASVAAVAKVHGIKKILKADGEALASGLAENLAPLIAGLAKGYSHILFSTTSFGKNLMPRVAALLDAQAISDIVLVESPDTFVRPIYAGNALCTVRSVDPVKVLSVRTTAFVPLKAEGGNVPVEEIPIPGDSGLSRFVGAQLTRSARPDLSSAKIVVSGGRALGSAENFKLIEALADKLGGAVGASRAAVDAGYIPNDSQVGQTGKIVAPDLYVAIGISGAIQHLAGIKDAKIIVAVNKDPDAPIFQVADYGLVGDLFEIVPELTGKL